MRASPDNPCQHTVNRRLIVAVTVATIVAGLIAANAHLVYVAIVSQPDCVPHTKAVGNDGVFRAARSAC